MFMRSFDGAYGLILAEFVYGLLMESMADVDKTGLETSFKPGTWQKHYLLPNNSKRSLNRFA